MLIVCFFAYKKLAQFAVRGALPPRRSESPICATDNKLSCVLHLLGWFIGSRGFSSLERRPKFGVLHNHSATIFQYQYVPHIVLSQGLNNIRLVFNSVLFKWTSFMVIVAVVHLLSHVQLFVTLWAAARQASLSFTTSWTLLKLMSIESVLPSNHLILYHPLLFLPSIFSSFRVFSNESTLHISWLEYWIIIIIRFHPIVCLKTQKSSGKEKPYVSLWNVISVSLGRSDLPFLCLTAQ